MSVKKLITGLLTLCIVSIGCVGCNSNEKATIYIEQSVASSLEVQEDYKLNVELGKGIQEELLDSIITGELSEKVKPYLASTVSMDSVDYVLTTTSVKYAEVLDYLTKADSMVYKESLGLTEPSQEEYVAMDNLLREGVPVYYFLDREQGTTEQYFVLKLNSVILKVGVMWLGGVIYDVNYQIS
jgi:hypothetical protein